MNRLESNRPNPEEFTIVHYEPISKDPFNKQNVAYRVCKSLGYRLDMRDEHEVTQPLPWVSHDPAVLAVGRFLGAKRTPGLAVLFDSDDTKRKVHAVVSHALSRTPTGQLLDSVSSTSSPAGVAFYHLAGYFQSEQEHGKPSDEVYKRCFVRSCERVLEHRPDMWELYANPSPGDTFGLDVVNLYNQLKQEQVKPIDPEGLGLLLIPVIENILHEQPELKP